MEKSVGSVIFKDKKYLLLKYGLGHWGFVKGHIEKNETEKETLYREAEEETGLKKENLKIINGFRENISYFFKKNKNTVYKKVVYYLTESNTDKITLSHEHSEYKWLQYDKAIEKLSFKNSKVLLKKAQEYLKK